LPENKNKKGFKKDESPFDRFVTRFENCLKPGASMGIVLV
jgi:hypothetical protein